MSDVSQKKTAPVRMGGLHGPGGRGAGGHSSERPKDARGTLRRLLAYLAPQRGKIIVVGIVATLSTVLALAAPWLMGAAIDQLIERNIEGLAQMCLLMFAAYFFSAGAQLVQGVLLVGVAQRAMRTLRATLFKRLQRFPLSFFDARRQGDLMSRLTNDMDAISRVLTDNAAQLFTGILTLVGILCIIFVLSPWLALGSMLVFPLMLGLVGGVGRRTRTAFRDYQKRLGELNAVLEETYSGQRVVLAFGQEETVLTQFDEANQAVRRVGVKAMTLALLVMPMMGILSNLNVAVLCGLGGWLAIKGMVTIGAIAAFITYSRRFAEPLRQLGNLYNQVQSALAGAERIFQLLDIPDEPVNPNEKEMIRVDGKVEFDHLSFSYVAGSPVLSDICLNVRPGERVALVGHTGAGKTTLVNLLSRFYEPLAGEIRIDGIDIRTVSRDSLRRQLGVVLQQSFLFSESVLENIRYGRLDASDEAVIKAAQLAHADGFIRRLPQGYGTILSERGENLSEGQRQLITIARAILADPAILVLDEATSSVDTRTEVQIQKALNELMKGRTSFVIAHRLSTIIHADLIVVIDKGRVVEQGSHETLLAQGGAYQHLYASQFRDQRVAKIATT
ncbi:ATP-binding cassette, subfamily B [Desulfuromusa kysingii]|uniref:ATP-binding cassette, subfamily B n=1 Tax=Desulfuromusa kysingii TaxID=37625 RepID=A0A1H4BGC6_9BACT|nr:ABC transporter ATP-binding protein [Desulfuromusa kysingii]SEA47181.1 ATP-binding cassette, subfamily B [Desulfuromusa kysingii]